MQPSTGSWWPLLASRELGAKPVGRARFGEQLVFWRNGNAVVCMPDRCPHRGAALSLGKVTTDGIACPFHGLAFAPDGRCTRVPVERDFAIPDSLNVATYPATEADGYVWVWRGPLPAGSSQPADLPSVPLHPDTLNMRFGEATGEWSAHYTRCIENVCDFSHLPYVHTTTIGRFKKDWQTEIEMEDVPGGFRAHLLERGKPSQSLEFLYPNRWLLRLAPRIMLGLVFAPVDATHTFVYGRTWYRFPLPAAVMNVWTRFSQYLVFREDWPIVASQQPGDVLTAGNEKLLPSDAPVIAYRKLHRAHYPR